MEEAGFVTGTKLDVRVMPGCLVITARQTITPLMQGLNKTNELPEDEQQSVIAFLQGVMARVELGNFESAKNTAARIGRDFQLLGLFIGSRWRFFSVTVPINDFTQKRE